MRYVARLFVARALASAALIPASAHTDHTLYIGINNLTGHWIYVDTYEPLLHRQKALVAPGGQMSAEGVVGRYPAF